MRLLADPKIRPKRVLTLLLSGTLSGYSIPLVRSLPFPLHREGIPSPLAIPQTVCRVQYHCQGLLQRDHTHTRKCRIRTSCF